MREREDVKNGRKNDEKKKSQEKERQASGV